MSERIEREGAIGKRISWIRKSSGEYKRLGFLTRRLSGSCVGGEEVVTSEWIVSAQLGSSSGTNRPFTGTGIHNGGAVEPFGDLGDKGKGECGEEEDEDEGVESARGDNEERLRLASSAFKDEAEVGDILFGEPVWVDSEGEGESTAISISVDDVEDGVTGEAEDEDGDGTDSPGSGRVAGMT